MFLCALLRFAGDADHLGDRRLLLLGLVVGQRLLGVGEAGFLDTDDGNQARHRHTGNDKKVHLPRATATWVIGPTTPSAIRPCAS